MSEKFRVHDSKILADQYTVAKQFMQNIHDMLQASDITDIADLPDSVVPTNVLLNLCICYSTIYDKLIEHQLISKLTSTKTFH